MLESFVLYILPWLFIGLLVVVTTPKKRRSTLRVSRRPTPPPYQPADRERSKMISAHGQLVRQLHGDSAAAKRLIQQTKSLNPSRSERWCIEKVLCDLQRDRR